MNWRPTAVGIVLTVLLAAVAFSGAVTAHGGDDGAHHHDGWMGTHDGMGWGMGWGMWFLWPALILLVAGGVAYVLLSQSGGTDPGPGSDEDNALAVLRERYARGEIDDEEFEQRRAALDDSR